MSSVTGPYECCFTAMPGHGHVTLAPSTALDAGDGWAEAVVHVMRRAGTKPDRLTEQRLLLTPAEMRAVHEALNCYYRDQAWSVQAVEDGL